MRTEIHPGGKAARSFIEQARRAQIVESAIEVLAEAGYRNASLARIAEHAGISKGVISYHFEGKRDLMDEVKTSIMGRIEAFLEPLMGAETTAAGALNTYISGSLQYLGDNRSHVLALEEIFFMNVSQAGRRPDYESVLEPAFQMLEEIFDRGQRNGEFRDFDTRVMAVTVQLAIEGASMQLISDPKTDLEHYGAELVRLFERAILRRPRARTIDRSRS